MKRFLLILIVCLFPSALLAEHISKVPIRFMNLEWGMSSADYMKAMKQNDYSFVKTNEGKNIPTHVHKGEILGLQVAVISGFEHDKLVKTIVLFMTDKSNYQEVFNEKYEAMKVKYGVSYSEAREFKPPFKEDDGYIDTAIQTGNAIIYNTYKDKDGNMAMITINEEFYVRIEYEAERYGELAKEMHKKANSVF